MKALSIHQPFANLIAYGLKNIENRTWRPPRGERILIHATKRNPRKDELDDVECLFDSGLFEVPEGFFLFPIGTILGSAQVGGYVTEGGMTAFDGHDARDFEGLKDSVWFNGPIGWVLTDVRRYTNPIPCKGFQGLWRPDVDVLSRCMDEEKAPRS